VECDSCGSHNVSRREIEGHLLFECHLCGDLSGDDGAVVLIDELREGRARGLDDEVIPLVSVLESTRAFKLIHASIGWREKGEAPSILFAASGGLRDVEKLLRSVEMANRETHFRWLVELTLQQSIVFVLRPRFFKPPLEITADEIRKAREDLGRLARCLRRDVSLSWWKA
jgi:hypothetical protein